MPKKKKMTQKTRKSAKKQKKPARKGAKKARGAKKAVKAAAKKFAAGARPAALMAEAAATDLLGAVRASAIVTGCAGATDTTKKLGDIGLDLLIFRTCVKNGIKADGFQPEDIPASASNTLDDVINEIQQCERA